MQAGLSQTQLADALFVSRDLVSKWETGKRHPDRKMLEAMAKIFGVAAEHLIDIDVHKKAENPCVTRSLKKSSSTEVELAFSLEK